MKAYTILEKMDEIEKKYPAEQRWHKLRLLFMAAAQAESQLTQVAADLACTCTSNYLGWKRGSEQNCPVHKPPSR